MRSCSVDSFASSSFDRLRKAVSASSRTCKLVPSSVTRFSRLARSSRRAFTSRLSWAISPSWASIFTLSAVTDFLASSSSAAEVLAATRAVSSFPCRSSRSRVRSVSMDSSASFWGRSSVSWVDRRSRVAVDADRSADSWVTSSRRFKLAVRSSESISPSSATWRLRRSSAWFRPDSISLRKNCASVNTISRKMIMISSAASASTKPGQILSAGRCRRDAPGI